MAGSPSGPFTAQDATGSPAQDTRLVATVNGRGVLSVSWRGRGRPGERGLAHG